MRPRLNLLRSHGRRAGAMAPVFALALPMLTAAVGFAVDGAALFTAQARLQVAADAAA
uniref:pilus assembly protein TadG-related protein n=1 Tax=Sandarakinorhabdus oryzae TaxID=2675220 RepID=UPI0018CBF978